MCAEFSGHYIRPRTHAQRVCARIPFAPIVHLSNYSVPFLLETRKQQWVFHSVKKGILQLWKFHVINPLKGYLDHEQRETGRAFLALYI